MSSPLPADDPYVVLGVAKDAQLPEIRSAHRKLVLKCHPDKVQDPTLKAEKQNEFQKVQQAYEILSNEQEREKYDAQVRLAELRKAKANSSASRSSRNAPAEYDVYYSSPRPSHRSSPSTAAPPTFKVYYTDDRSRGPRVVDAEPRGTTRREGSFVERDSRPSKRESEREAREREKERDRDRERERRKRADKEAREYKEAKEARRAEKKAKEKQQAKEYRRETEEKRSRYMTPEEDVPPPRMEKKSSSSHKYETREPSIERDRRDDYGYNEAKMEAAINYINAARINAGGAPRRAKTYHGRTPFVPSPPPAPGVASAYPSPDEDEVRRSSASTRRRGSADVPKVAREKSYSKSSRERLDEEPVIREARPPPGFPKSMSSAAAAAGLSSSPPRPMARTNTMPHESTSSRPMPGMTRAQTFTEGATPKGRMRSKMEPQVELDSEDEDVYERERERERRLRDREATRESRDNRDSRDARDRKQRSSKKHRSPERYEEEPRTTHISYKYARDDEGGPPRAKFQSSYTRRLDPESESYGYGSGARYVERPSLARESSYSSTYSTPVTKFPKVRETKLNDVQYSKYPTATYA
ncbi:dnaJ domain-containing protein [Sarocladium implicatum]|nr:dnaJ domain-containing protein [Sarocladium implicatum]